MATALPRRRRRAWPWIAAALVAAAAAAAAAVWAAGRAVPGTAAAPAIPTATARVIRGDLVTTQRVTGTIGYGPATTLVAPAAATRAAVAQVDAAVGAASARLASDRATVRDTAAANAAALAVDQATLSGDQARRDADCAATASSPQCIQDQQKVAVDQAQLAATRAHDQQTLDQAQAAVDQDQAALAGAQAQAAPVEAVAGSGGTTYSSLPAVGAVVVQGQALYSIDGRPVPLLYGPQAAYRVLAIGTSGPDVERLEQDLIALGFGGGSSLVADGSYTAADAAAVRRWQAALGLPQTGTVNLGDVVFQPGPVRVTALHAGPGSPVSPGAPIMDVTPATRIVSVALDPALAYEVRRGDAVTVDLPDGHTRVPGTVSDVSTVATQQAGGGQQTPNGAPQATIGVTIAFAGAGAVPDLDQAPVAVDVTTQSARNVLAVPVDALLALAGGGYGVEVVEPGGGQRLVVVRTGIFDASRVEVSGPGLSEGMTVVVPAS